MLRSICDHLGLHVTGKSPAILTKAIEEHLRKPAARAAAVADLTADMRPALALLPYVPVGGWCVEDVRDLLRQLGCAAPEKAVRALIGLGLLALYVPDLPVKNVQMLEFVLAGWRQSEVRLVPYPALAHDPGYLPFKPPRHGVTEDVRTRRVTDGLELLLRVAALWQRVLQTPLKLTMHRELFKRDQERLAVDPVLQAPLFDELAAVPAAAELAMVLATHAGIIVPDPDALFLRARLNGLWQEGLPAIQRRFWEAILLTRDWIEPADDTEEFFDRRRVPGRRLATVLLLAAIEPDAWIALTTLDAEVTARTEDRAVAGPRRAKPFRVVVGTTPAAAPVADERSPTMDWLEAFLLGVMYQLGAVEAAEDATSGAPVVRLSPLGRWLLCVGRPPPSPPMIEKTLFVQPNHEVVVYRQGLTPELIGQLASFCRWKSSGAALTLELTAESVYCGLELGRAAEEMIGILDRHSQRPLPPGVLDSIRTWSERRERMQLFSRCTVLEFSSRDDLDQAVKRGVMGERINDRLLVVADERTLPFQQFRLSPSRDYRLAPVLCVSAADDGVTWEVDLTRSDLLVESELARFAEPLPHGPADRLRYRITVESLAKAARLGLRGPYVRDWFRRRADEELPASVELMLQASSRTAIHLAHLFVLQLPTAAVTDGIMQHPRTRPRIQTRLGPTALAIVPEHVEALRAALQELGIEVAIGPALELGDTES
jgi:hypothetical protein